MLVGIDSLLELAFPQHIIEQRGHPKISVPAYSHSSDVPDVHTHSMSNSYLPQALVISLLSVLDIP